MSEWNAAMRECDDNEFLTPNKTRHFSGGGGLGVWITIWLRSLDGDENDKKNPHSNDMYKELRGNVDLDVTWEIQRAKLAVFFILSLEK